ncbi:endonuclease/exonuclease/phosphatase family protein [Oceanihabitans sp. 2_MG-2023]|uniref:endonuclease/exonuclease/phosphatase family protein n=1 Tax=Oceanihabitans sp. 2_MG-2023 TaxID=3062661 RepID=UPI0026E24D42|nr:endonuclease/exonuclease/phosphatase family protein [Oceanihabitans sp. 2_MG-2023]MDO6597606.1 endonuclease/exonuclease/phosphatase family protein [Oceanihabitans sp. 2_MG-2023]
MKKTLKKILVSFGILFLVSGIFFFWASASNLTENNYQKLEVNQLKQITDTDSIYSIVTYNIGYLSGMTNNLAVEKPKTLFDTNLQHVLTEFKNINPDIIAFQEIDFDASRSYHINQHDTIAKLGYNFEAETVNWDKTYVPFPYWPPTIHFGKVISGQSVLSKYPINSQERKVLKRVTSSPFYRDAFYLERLAQVVKVTIENQEVVLINVHLEAFNTQTRASQLQEVMAIFNTYAATNPTILLGDFNSDAKDENAVIKTLLKSKTIGNAAFSKNNIACTYNSEKPEVRIDYIFYTKKYIAYIDGKVLNKFGSASDHLPVEMHFKLK